MASSQEESNFYRVVAIVVDISTAVFRDLLTAHVPPSNLLSQVNNIPPKVKNKNLSAQQHNDISIAANCSRSYAGFDSTLCYFLLRNLCPSLEPTEKWGKTPIKKNNTNPGDDIERLRIYRNEMFAHAASASLSIGAYVQFIKEIGAVYARFDLYCAPR